MNQTVRITLEGIPERVHEIADVLDQAGPGTFEWLDAAATGNGIEILLEGVGSREETVMNRILSSLSTSA